MLFTITALAIGWLITGEFRSGLGLGGGVFLTWALTREIDPAHNYSAFIAACLSLVQLLYTDAIHFLMMAWILLLLRAVNGITGKKLTLFDLFSALSLTIFLSFNNKNSIYLIIFILALIGLCIRHERKIAVFISAMITLVLFIGQILFLDYLSIIPMDLLKPLLLLVIFSSILFVVLTRCLLVDQVLDDKGHIADPSRIFYGQLLYSSTAILFVFFGSLMSNDLVLLLATLWGVFINFIGHKILAFYKKTTGQ